MGSKYAPGSLDKPHKRVPLNKFYFAIFMS